MLLPTILFAALTLLTACEPRNGGNGPAAAPAPEASSATQSESAPTDNRTSRARIEVQGEPTVGEATIVVYLLTGGEGVSDAQVKVTGDMTHAGMMPVIASATETEAGLYTTEDFRFTMAGDWVLTGEIEYPDGTTATTETEVTVGTP